MAGEFGRIYRMARHVAGAIRHKANQRIGLAERLQNHVRNLQHGKFLTCADIKDFSVAVLTR